MNRQRHHWPGERNHPDSAENVEAAEAPTILVGSDNENIYVEASVPNIEPTSVSIAIEDDVLHLTGDRIRPDFEPGDRRLEGPLPPVGALDSRIVLPLKVDSRAVSASLSQGVLRIILPRLGADTRARLAVTRH